MEKKVDYHPSQLIAESSDGRLLMSVYDFGYPIDVFRLSPSLIGGNPNTGDANPEVVLRRELEEEFDPDYDKWNEASWASRELIRDTRDSMLQGLEPFADFYAQAVHIRRDLKTGGLTEKWYDAVFSVFYASIDRTIVNGIQKAIGDFTNSRRVVTEGLVGVFDLDILERKGELGTAHLTAPVLNEKYGTNIPTLDGVTAERLVTPVRNNFEDYHREFDYQSSWLKV